MRVPLATILIAIAAAAALTGCRTSPHVEEGYGLLEFSALVCDTALKRTLLPADIPDVPLTVGYGSITGIVYRAGTGDGIDRASVILSPHDAPMSPADRRHVTGQTGGFAFDSVVPGRYRLRVLAVSEHPASSFVAVTSDRIDTVRFPIQALGICNR